MSEAELERARAGDEQAFRELTTPYMRELHVHCYRMLGSLADADDLLQETLVAAWTGLGSFAGDASLRRWLYRIATNRCLNAIRDSKRRAPPEPVPPFEPPRPSGRGEVTWLQPYPDDWFDQLADRAHDPETKYQARESIELAFITALQLLPPRQTATLLLCDVLGFSTLHSAAMLATTPTAIKGMLQRARASVARRQAAAGHGGPPPAGSAAEQDLARRFATAFASDDVEGVVALLTDDAWLSMPPAPHQYHGVEAIASFLRASFGWQPGRSVRLHPTRANTQPAFGYFVRASDGSVETARGLLVLTLREHRVSGITHFLAASLCHTFSLT